MRGGIGENADIELARTETCEWLICQHFSVITLI